jgi:hypothetical protein
MIVNNRKYSGQYMVYRQDKNLEGLTHAVCIFIAYTKKESLYKQRSCTFWNIKEAKLFIINTYWKQKIIIKRKLLRKNIIYEITFLF